MSPHSLRGINHIALCLTITLYVLQVIEGPDPLELWVRFFKRTDDFPDQDLYTLEENQYVIYDEELIKIPAPEIVEPIRKYRRRNQIGGQFFYKFGKLSLA
jgi:hypothetical protein